LSVPALLPVVIVTGLHRQARRRAVRELLADRPDAVVLHHNSSASGNGEVVRRVRDRRGLLTARVPLDQDFPGCASREDLLPQLVRIARDGRHGLAIVDLWGGGDPQPLVEKLAEAIPETEVGGRCMAEVVRVVAVVAAVEPFRVISELSRDEPLSGRGLPTGPAVASTIAETLVHQIEYANVLAVDLAPGVPGPQTRVGLALLRQLCPTVRAVNLGSGGLIGAVFAGFEVDAAAQRMSPPMALLPQEAENDGVATLVWKRRQPLHPARLYEALGQLVPTAQRSRGRFWLANRPDVMLGWDAAGASLRVQDCGPWLTCVSDDEWDRHPPERRLAAALDWDPSYGDRVQLLSFTAEHLDAKGIAELLDTCLLTDEELAAGESGWKALPDAFGELLDPPEPAPLPDPGRERR
jgi:G3E family GTPase